MDTYRRHVAHPRDSGQDKYINLVVVPIQSRRTRTLVKLEPEVIACPERAVNRVTPRSSLRACPGRRERTEPCASELKTSFDSLRSSTISRNTENSGFTCGNCDKVVAALVNGSYRNHCPHCLHSLHVDISPGDRANDCRALMRPVGVEYHSAKGYMIVHQCTSCGTRRRNRMADDPHQGDDLDTVLALMCHGHHEARRTNRRQTHI